MRISVFGSGMVGNALATKLVKLGHEVMMGSRDVANEKAVAWASANGARNGDYAQAATFGELVIFAVPGGAVVETAQRAGPDALAGKVVIDVSNPLDMSRGFPPSLLPELSNTTSAAEALQAALPGAHVVKALNTMNCQVMVDPARVPGRHDVFLCGDDAAAKAQVQSLLQSFGWAAPIDLGPLSAARGLEGLMPFWLRLFGALGTADFNYSIARA